MKKIFGTLSIVFASLLITSCFGKASRDATFGVLPKDHDSYFGSQISFADTRSSVPQNADGNLAGNFQLDGVAAAEVVSVTDGDTAVFRNIADPEGSSTFNVRFLLINTPEVSGTPEPWGRAATTFVQELIPVGSRVIVDALDLLPSDRVDQFSRWLALVWFLQEGGDPENLEHYRLMQLEIIENSFSEYVGTTSLQREREGTRYVLHANPQRQPELFDTFRNQLGALSIRDVASLAAVRTATLGRRVLGREPDPDFDSNDMNPVVLTVKGAVEGFAELERRSTVVEITGRVTDVVGRNFFIQDADGYGIYVFLPSSTNPMTGPGINNPLFSIGDTVRVIGRLGSHNGSRQIIDVNLSPFPLNRPYRGIRRVTNVADQIAPVEVLDLNQHMKSLPTETDERAELNRLQGRLVKISALTTNSNSNELNSGAFTIETNFSWADGSTSRNIDIRVHNNTSAGSGMFPTGFIGSHFGESGTQIVVIGGLSVINQDFQIILGNQNLQSQRPEGQYPLTVNNNPVLPPVAEKTTLTNIFTSNLANRNFQRAFFNPVEIMA